MFYMLDNREKYVTDYRFENKDKENMKNEKYIIQNMSEIIIGF